MHVKNSVQSDGPHCLNEFCSPYHTFILNFINGICRLHYCCGDNLAVCFPYIRSIVCMLIVSAGCTICELYLLSDFYQTISDFYQTYKNDTLFKAIDYYRFRRLQVKGQCRRKRKFTWLNEKHCSSKFCQTWRTVTSYKVFIFHWLSILNGKVFCRGNSFWSWQVQYTSWKAWRR